MPELKSIFPIRGTLDDFVFYKMNGKTIVRRKPNVSRETLMTSPKYQRCRETMSEFGASAIMGKSMRGSWAQVKKKFQGPYISGRLNGRIKSQIASHGPGKSGQRQLNLRNNPPALENFPVDRNLTFDQIFRLPHTLTPNSARTEVVLEIPALPTSTTATARKKLINTPSGASHYRIWLLTSTISDYEYNPDHKGYHPANPDENEQYALVQSQPIPLNDLGKGPLTLTATLPILTQLSQNVSLISALGIDFQQEVNQEYFDLKENSTMKIASIY